MICCLLALLAAFPGVSLIHRWHVGYGELAPGTRHGAYRPGRNMIRGLAIACIVGVIASAALAIHIQYRDVAWHALGPICSTLGVLLP
jgi:hypothetical protein